MARPLFSGDSAAKQVASQCGEVAQLTVEMHAVPGRILTLGSGLRQPRRELPKPLRRGAAVGVGAVHLRDPLHARSIQRSGVAESSR